jgi:hypothetical protein
MPDRAMRSRVERLMSGNFRPDDLTRLFLYARDRCDGRESVQEIGDFVAHHDERSKGLITRSCRDWVTSVQFWVKYATQRKIDLNRLPSNFIDVLHSGFRQTSSDVTMLKVGLKKSAAGKLLPDLIKKLIRNPDDTIGLSPQHTQSEVALAQCLTTILTMKSAFTGDKLFSDFGATLNSLSLLKKSEQSSFSRLKPAISLFAVSVMHNCVIRLDDGTTVKLQAEGPTGGLHVSLTNPSQNPNERLPTSMFSAGLQSCDYCEVDLLATPLPWDVDLEITSSMRLGILR